MVSKPGAHEPHGARTIFSNKSEDGRYYILNQISELVLGPQWIHPTLFFFMERLIGGGGRFQALILLLIKTLR